MARRSTFGSVSAIPDAVDRRPHAGAPVPLLDRLVDDDPQIRDRELHPRRTLDLAGLQDSVQAELSRLFNTRAPVSVRDLVRHPRSVIDYGIPDFSTYTADGPEGLERFARQAEAAVRAFEPRLAHPHVRVVRAADTRLPLWRAVIEGVLQVGALRDPIQFIMSLPTATDGESSAP